MRPDPDSFENWKDWANAHAQWVDSEMDERLQLWATPENIHYFGSPGEPPFLNSWRGIISDTQRPGFYKDPFGYVHLCGVIEALVYEPVGSNIAQLPLDYTPADQAGKADAGFYQLTYPRLSPFLPTQWGFFIVNGSAMLRWYSFAAPLSSGQGATSLTGFSYKSRPPLAR